MPHQPTPSQWAALREAEQRLLEHCPVPVRAWDISVEGEPIHVLETGAPELPPLVMIHGRGSAGALFASVFPLLAPHRHIYTIDMRGWGLSTRAPFTGTTPDSAVNWWRDGLIGAIDALGLEHYDLLGHSLGGMMAIMVALARPEQIEHLVLEDNGGFPGTVPLAVRLYFNVSPERLARLASRATFDRAVQSSIPTEGQSPESIAATRDFIYQLTTLPGTDFSGVRAFNKILDIRGSHFSVAKQLGNLQPMTRAIWGEKDPVIPLKIVKANIQRIPHAELVVIPGVGHSPHVEAPTVFARHVLTFLAHGAEVPLSNL